MKRRRLADILDEAFAPSNARDLSDPASGPDAPRPASLADRRQGGGVSDRAAATSAPQSADYEKLESAIRAMGCGLPILPMPVQIVPPPPAIAAFIWGGAE